jgi:hypothetical protein
VGYQVEDGLKVAAGKKILQQKSMLISTTVCI